MKRFERERRERAGTSYEKSSPKPQPKIEEDSISESKGNAHVEPTRKVKVEKSAKPKKQCVHLGGARRSGLEKVGTG